MSEKLNILWVNDNPTTADSMVFMYATNAKLNNWFDQIEIIIWGASAKLTSENERIQQRIKEAKEAGVIVKGCISCAKMFGVVEELKALEIELIPMGIPLTKILKEKEYLLTI